MNENKDKYLFATVTYSYKGADYTTTINFHSCSEEGTLFMLEEGNYSCDCNKSICIEKDYPNFKLMDCGYEIKTKSIELKYM